MKGERRQEKSLSVRVSGAFGTRRFTYSLSALNDDANNKDSDSG